MKTIHPLRQMRVENVLASLWEDTTGLGQPDVVTIAYDRDIDPQLEFELNDIYSVITALLGLAMWAQANRLANPTMTPLSRI